MEKDRESPKGHEFRKKVLRPGNSCHHCGDSLWGSALSCSACKFAAHDRCSSAVVSPCLRMSINEITRPVAHKWSSLQKFKKKFCNVCRKRMDDRNGRRCEVCKYYAHKACITVSLPVCKRSAEYNTFVTPDESSNTRHQWLEGNLKASDKCRQCHQSCYSDCLTAFRCLYCHTAVHSACKHAVSEACDLGVLRNIYLPAYSVYRPEMSLFQAHVTATISEHNAMPAPAGTYAEQMLGYRLHDAEGDNVSLAESISPEVTSNSGAMVTLKIFDSTLDQFKKITVPADADPSEILVAAQVEFNISQEESAMFCIALETTPKSYEPVTKLAGQMELTDKLVFRSTDQLMSSIRIYHSTNNHNTEVCVLSVSPLTTTVDVVQQAIASFGLVVSPEQLQDYVLTEMNMYDGLAERILEDSDKPYVVLHDHAKESVQRLQMVRLYLRNVKMDIPATIYVGDLPKSWDGPRLINSLQQALGTGMSDNIEFGPAFPQYGCIFLSIRNENLARQACLILRTAIYIEHRRPKVMVVPTIKEEVIPEDCNPLLTFINERSGGGQGSELYVQMIRLLNPNQVFNLSHGGPLLGLYAFRNIKQFKILVAGGDGTVGWVLSQLDAMRDLWKNPSAPVAVIPLGTGNDLARVLRWGAGYTGESAMSVLEMIEDSLVVPLDRWNVVFEPDRTAGKATFSSLMGSLLHHTSIDLSGEDELGLAEKAPSLAAQIADKPQSYVMNNYLGIGVEAEIALKFHLAREENPEKFSSRLHNKGVYLKMSISKMMQRGDNDHTRDLSHNMTMDVDGERIKLPSGLGGIIFLNIKSWMAGCDGWGSEREDRFRPPSMNDGLLEIIGVQGVMHLGQIQGGLRGGIRLGQGSVINFRLSTPTPIEIDGEPFLQPVGRCKVTQGNTAQMMRRHKRYHGSFPNVPTISAS